MPRSGMPRVAHAAESPCVSDAEVQPGIEADVRAGTAGLALGDELVNPNVGIRLLLEADGGGCRTWNDKPANCTYKPVPLLRCSVPPETVAPSVKPQNRSHPC